MWALTSHLVVLTLDLLQDLLVLTKTFISDIAKWDLLLLKIFCLNIWLDCLDLKIDVVMHSEYGVEFTPESGLIRKFPGTPSWNGSLQKLADYVGPQQPQRATA